MNDVPEVDFDSLDTMAAFHDRIDSLRKDHWCARDRHGLVFFSQEDAMHVLRCQQFRFSFFGITRENSPYLADVVDNELLAKHGGSHQRLRRLVAQALRDKVVEGLTDQISTIVEDLIDRFPEHGVVDLATEFGDHIPSRVLGPMLGIRYDDIAEIDGWIRIGTLKSDPANSPEAIRQIEAANRSFHQYLRNLLRERRKAPGSDIFSELIETEIDGDRLSEDELVILAAELAMAGVDTTRNQIPLIIEALLLHPDQLQSLGNNPDLIDKAVEEGMRWAPLAFALPHEVTEAHTYRDVDFQMGDRVNVVVPAVNRDPAVFLTPHDFDLSRKTSRHFNFGFGPHACVGAQLARLEMKIALATLLRRVRINAPANGSARGPVTRSCHFKNMPVTISRI